MKKINKKEQKKRRIQILVVILLIIVLLSGLVGSYFIYANKYSLDRRIIKINNNSFSYSDFMVRLYINKVKLLNTSTPSNEVLNKLVNDKSNKTVKSYLRSAVINEIMTCSAILDLSNEFEIYLDGEDYASLKDDKEIIIDSLGGLNKYYSFLKENNTTDKAYDKMKQIDKLYMKIYEEIYVPSLNDSTKKTYKDEYFENYYKIKQIVLAKFDEETNSSLSEEEIKDKEIKINEAYDELNNGESFIDVLNKYSDLKYSEDSAYYYKDDLQEEVLNEIKLIEVNNYTKIVETDEAYVIIYLDKLDESKLEDYYEYKTQEKFKSYINEKINAAKVIYTSNYSSININ